MGEVSRTLNLTPSMLDMSIGVKGLMYAQEKGAGRLSRVATLRAEKEVYDSARNVALTVHHDLKIMHDAKKRGEALAEWQEAIIELCPEGPDGTFVMRPGQVGHDSTGWSILLTEKGNFQRGPDIIGNEPKKKEIRFGKAEYIHTFFETTQWLRKNIGRRAKKIQE